MDALLACRSIPDKNMCLIFKHGQNEELKSGTRFSGARNLPCTINICRNIGKIIITIPKL